MHTWASVVQTIASGVGTAFIIYIATLTRRGIRKFMREHDWLIETTKRHSEQIDNNSASIVRILELQERRERRRG